MSQSLSFSRRTLPCKNEAYASASSRPYRMGGGASVTSHTVLISTLNDQMLAYEGSHLHVAARCGDAEQLRGPDPGLIQPVEGGTQCRGVTDDRREDMGWQLHHVHPPSLLYQYLRMRWFLFGRLMDFSISFLSSMA